MKIFDLNTNQVAILATQEEFDSAEMIMQEGGRYSTNITIAGDTVKAFVWGISDDTKNKLYALAGIGQGVAVEGVQADTFKIPETTVDPELEEKVNQAMEEMQANPIPENSDPIQTEPQSAQVVQQPPILDKIKAITQNAYTYCAAAYIELYHQLYNQNCPDINTQEFMTYINWITQSWMTMAEQGQDISQWIPWIDYIYNVGCAAYKETKKA